VFDDYRSDLGVWRAASDEEIARQVRRRKDGLLDDSGGRDGLAEYKQAAGEIHDELARRIRETERDVASTEDLAAVVERLDALEARP